MARSILAVLALGSILAGCLGPGPQAPALEPIPPTPDAVRFLVVGDTGTGLTPQYAVADAMAEVCGELGCDFALLLGDAIYESGVSGPDDPQFLSKFERPYANFSIPFYVVLGNHDYGANGVGAELTKGQANVDYSERSSKWTMPATYYHVAAGPVDLFGLDSGPASAHAPAFEHTYITEQGDWLATQLAASTAPWRIVFAHHPYISNGVHGDAGQYDGVPGQGGGWRDMLQRVACGEADFYLAGHDHDLQWLEPTDGCGNTEFIVSGAGAKKRGQGDGRHPASFQEFDTTGFVWMQASNTTMHVRFYDGSGQGLFQDSRSA